MGDFDKLKELLNLGVVPLVGIFLFTFFVLFLPTPALEILNLVDIKNSYSTYFGLGFLFSATFLVALILNSIWKVFLGNWLKEKANVYLLKKELNNLTNEEKTILNYFIEGKTRSIDLSVKDGNVLGLEKRMIITKVGNLGTDAVSFLFPFNIQPWAWKFLNKNPHLLEIKD